MNRENGKIKRPLERNIEIIEERGRWIDRTAKGDEDKSCLDSIRVPKLAENANIIELPMSPILYAMDAIN